MLTDNSILRRLPPGLDQKQLVFLEGIRHAAEIAWVAYLRLERALTSIVDNSSNSPPTDQIYTEAFMDAWAVVDAIDRFRQLWRMFPGIQFAPQSDDRPSFDQLTSAIRGLRNVTDHLAQRADYIAASGKPVLGLLTWVTLKQDQPLQAYTCLLAPGTQKKASWTAVNPAGMEFTSYVTGRTGLIHLAAGEHKASLSAVIPEMTDRINSLEHNLEAELSRLGVAGKQAGADLFLALELTLHQGPAGI